MLTGGQRVFFYAKKWDYVAYFVGTISSIIAGVVRLHSRSIPLLLGANHWLDLDSAVAHGLDG